MPYSTQGVTNNLKRRVYEHREKRVEGFTKKYNVTKLVIARVFSEAIFFIMPDQSR
ncbi:GIY-YIG nuclease family protein [Candidatus Kuenenia stuttgartiensis]|uniref:GIY-YIG nuclease family protein n=1 Tax=Kuenenia stuttgartiensis TaxID=174633 RepID=UPI003B967C6C